MSTPIKPSCISPLFSDTYDEGDGDNNDEEGASEEGK